MPNLCSHRSVRCLLIFILAVVMCITSACSADAGSVPDGEEDLQTTPSLMLPQESETTAADTTIQKTKIDRTYSGYTATLLVDAAADLVLFDDAVAERYHLADAERRAVLEEMLDITLAVQTQENAADYLARAALSETVPDLVEFNSASQASSLITGGQLADLGTIPNFRLDNYAIDQSLTNALSIATHTYLLFGDATARDQYISSAVLVNVDEATSCGFTPEMLMDLVKNGNWTLEQWLTVSVAGNNDLDGDAVLPFFVGAGGTIFSKTEQDIPTITIDAAFSQAYDAMQQAMNVPVVEDDETALFRIGTLGELEAGWIALPMPTLSSAENYRTSVEPKNLPCVAVPAAQTDAARTGDILTVWFETSADTVGAVVRENLDALQTASGGDTKMLDLILQNRFCSHGALFGWGALTESLRESVGMTEADFLQRINMQMTAASRAMEILVGRLQ